MPKSILVITDVHESERCALQKAHDLASPLGVEVNIVQFIKTANSTIITDDEIKQQSQALANAVTDIFNESNDKQAITTQVIVTNNIVAWVVEHCAKNNFDLVVKAGHRTESLFHTPCDWALIRKLQVPVLIASQQHWRSQHSVLAAVDPDAKDRIHQELNQAILHWSKKWALAFNSTIHLVYNLPVPKILKELDIVDVKEYARKHKSEGEQKLLALIQGHDLPKVKLHVTAGSVDKTIPRCANQLKAELVIMGSVGRSGLTAKVIGNVAEKVMHKLRTDSLVIEAKK